MTLRPDDLGHVCVACGDTGRPRVAIPGAMLATVQVCVTCLARYGARTLREVADKALALMGGVPAAAARCRHCGEAVVVLADGDVPIWCQACDAEWRALTR